MSKGNDKKQKSDKTKLASVSSYKSQQSTGKPGVISTPAKKPGR